MSIGLNPSKAEIDATCGVVARDLQKALDRVETFKYWLDSKVDADLTALGYTPGEIAIMRSAWADAAQLYDIYSGSANLATAKDFRTFIRQVWGLGNL
jgi:hypothetical protein